MGFICQKQVEVYFLREFAVNEMSAMMATEKVLVLRFLSGLNFKRVFAENKTRLQKRLRY